MPSRPWRAVLVGGAVVVVIAVALAVTSGGDDGSTPEAGSTSRSTEPLRSLPGAAEPGTVEIPDVFEFEAPLLDGGTLRGAEYRDTGVARWFWAPWCTPCNREAPGVEQVARRRVDQVPIVGMAGRDDRDAMQAFVDQYSLGFLPHTVDDDGSLWRQFRVLGQPAWVFVQPDGSARVAFGELSAERLNAELDLIAEGAPA
jgi:thiol-disulfide isomerase/thioredoxin